LNEALLYTLGLTDSQERLQAVTEAFQAGHVSRSDGGDVCGTCVNFTNQKNMRITHHRVTGIIFGFELHDANCAFTLKHEDFSVNKYMLTLAKPCETIWQ
jgi:hypothetical protein